MPVSVLNGRISGSVDEGGANAGETNAALSMHARKVGTTYYELLTLYMGYDGIYSGVNLYRRLSGVNLLIGSASGVVGGGAFTLEIVGSSLVVKQGTTTLISLTNTAVSAAGDWGWSLTYSYAGTFTSLDGAGFALPPLVHNHMMNQGVV